jgi:hypothetical protein
MKRAKTRINQFAVSPEKLQVRGGKMGTQIRRVFWWQRCLERTIQVPAAACFRHLPA